MSSSPPSIANPFYILLLLFATFALNFAYHDGWKDAQAPGDEPAYIENAYNYWHSDHFVNIIGNPGYLNITWSPGYVLLMSPFVGIFGQETGYKIWRFTLFAGTSFMVYFAFSRMFGSAWLGASLALFSQMFIMPYAAPSLQLLACFLYLICLRLLIDKTRFLGFTFGALLNGIFISGTVGGVLFSFGVLCMAFYPRLIFSRRFFIQFLAGAALFGVILHHFNYDILKYSEQATQRGRFGLYHQLSLYIVSSGRSAPYLKPEDDLQNNVDEYHRHLKAIDRYYLDKFGEKEHNLRARRHDEQWPLFLLDWPWMITKDPGLMKEYGQEIFRTLKESLLMSFQIILPFGDYNFNTSSPKRGMYAIPIIFVLMLPHLIGLVRKKPINYRPPPIWPSRLQLLFLLSCLSSLIPLILVKPLSIYFPPLIPCYLMVIALLASLPISGIRKYFASKPSAVSNLTVSLSEPPTTLN